MRTATITERELNQLKASTYILGNGIRRQRKTTKVLSYGFYLQTLLGLTLGVLALISYHNYQVANSHLKQTETQLRYEAGQAASFKAWFDQNCTGETRDRAVCDGVQ